MEINNPPSVPSHIRIDRVLINKEGEAVNRQRAEQLGIKLEIAFVRSDGWTLSAPKGLVLDAFRLWTEEWRHFWRDGKVRRIDEFSPDYEGSVI